MDPIDQMNRSMQPTMALVHHVLVTLRQDLSLLGDLLQSTQHDTITSNKAMSQVLDFRVGAEIAHQRLQATEIMAQ